MATIKVIITKDGQSSVDYDGFKGKLCYEEAEKLKARMKALGVDTEACKVEDKGEAVVEQAREKA